jgi:hypothetical protein
MNKQQKLEQVMKLMAELEVDQWDVYAYVTASEVKENECDPSEYLDGWVSAEQDDPTFLANMADDIRMWIKMM